jgi:pilus assembly protein CpaC
MLTWTGTQRHERPGGRRLGWRGANLPYSNQGRRVRTALAGLTVALGAMAALTATSLSQAQQPAGGSPVKALGAPRTSAHQLIARRPDPATMVSAQVAPDAGKNGPPAANAAPAGNAAPAEAPLPIPSPATTLPIPPRPSVITAESSQYIKQTAGPDNILEVIVGRIQIFDLIGSPKRVQVGDESVANYVLMSTTELSLQGLRIGSTVLNVWFQDMADPNKSKLVSFLVRVLPDPDARNRLERAYKNLEKEINKVFPDSKVYLQLIGDKLAVCGQAKDIADANMIMRMVNANILPETADAPDLSRAATADPNTQIGRMYPAFHRQVVNMMRVPGEQQVMLQVQVVEVDRAAARSIGLNFGTFRNTGSFFVGGTTGNLGFTGQGAGGFANFGGNNLGLTGLGGLPNLPIAIDNGQIQLACLALRNLSYARYLAEPNLVAMNGVPANFQAGGLLPVPVLGGIGGFGANLAGVNFIPTGVQLQFTPFITERDRVRLTINAEISDRDLNVVPTLIDGAAVPSLITRNFSTTVELREGQTLAVAGLIENKLDADSSRMPLLGCIPILGRLAGYDRIGNREKELVILVTPRLVHPMECNEVPPLPGLDILEPNDWEFYLLGRLESHIAEYRSPIRTDCDRKKQARAMEQHFLFGASGPSMDLPPDATEAAAKPPVPDLHPAPNGRMPQPVLNAAPQVNGLPMTLPPPPSGRPATPYAPAAGSNATAPRVGPAR